MSSYEIEIEKLENGFVVSDTWECPEGIYCKTLEMTIKKAKSLLEKNAKGTFSD
jgi:hypothetical protein